jgi:SAM-dependent methyltransferase
MNRDLIVRYYRLLAPVRRVLDLGCGAGAFGRWMPCDQVGVFGLDVSARALDAAKRWERVALVDLDREVIPFRDGSFDAVLAKDILEHLQRPWKTMAEIRRVLAPGGRLLISTPLAKPQVVWDDYTHMRGFTRRALRQMVEDNGFEVLQIHRMGSLPGFGKLGLIDLLPALMDLPLVGPALAVNHELCARKI